MCVCLYVECVRSLCLCVRVCGAGLCERNGAAEQELSPLVCEAHRVPQGWVSWLLQIRDNGTSACLSLDPLPHPLSPFCLLPGLPSTGLCERVCLLASSVPTRRPVWSRDARSQERGPLACRVQLMCSPRCISSRVPALVPVTCFLR